MDTPLSNEDIEQALGGVDGFRGVSSYDLLPNLGHGQFIIINTDNVLPIGLASDDVKLVLNNNSVPGYGHTHVHKDWKILCRTQASFAIDRFFDRLFSELPWIRENFLLPRLAIAECFILTTNLETGRESCCFQAPRSPDEVSVACIRTRVNSLLVLRTVDCGSMFAGKWDHQSERAEGR